MGWLLNIIGNRAQIYTIIAAFIAGGLCTAYVQHKFHQADQLAAVNTARTVERSAGTLVYTASNQSLQQTARQLKAADERANRLSAALANVPACPVSNAAVRLLNESTVPAAAGSTRQPDATPAPAKAVDTNDVAKWAADNNATVCIPNADDYAALQQFYRDLRAQYNRRGLFR